MERTELLQAMGRLKVETGSLACLGCGYEHNCSTRGCAILRAAAEALAAPTNEPLTIEQMREMDGEPVWFDTIKRCGIVKVCRDGVFVLTKSGEFEVGRCKYYRRPPEGEEDA